MSKVFKKIAFLDPIANAISGGGAKGLIDPTASMKAEKAKQAEKEANAQAEAAKGNAPGQAVAAKVKEQQFGNRREDLRAAAGAAGAKYTASDYDLLGTNKNVVKRKSASKSLLGE